MPPTVLPGIDVLAASGFAAIKGMRIGLLTHHAGRDIAGQRTIDVLATAPGVKLVSILSPEHGLDADRDGKIASGRDAATGLPVHSLYGATRRPTEAMLAGLDAVVIDLQDVGVRFYTYATTMAYVLEAAAKQQLKMIVLDRPNPIAPAGSRGPVIEPQLRSFIGYLPVPVQHGLTLGELARLHNGEQRIGADLTVISVRGGDRSAWFDQTGLDWPKPSPNLSALSAVTLYAGTGMIEFANVSVGRGTPTPFEVVGAPWIDGRALARTLDARGIAGVRIAATEFTPSADRHAGKACKGVRIEIADRSALDAVRLGIELASALHRANPRAFKLGAIAGHLGSREILAAIEAGQDPAAIEARWQPGLRAFEALRLKYQSRGSG